MQSGHRRKLEGGVVPPAKRQRTSSDSFGQSRRGTTELFTTGAAVAMQDAAEQFGAAVAAVYARRPQQIQQQLQMQQQSHQQQQQHGPRPPQPQPQPQTQPQSQTQLQLQLQPVEGQAAAAPNVGGPARRQLGRGERRGASKARWHGRRQAGRMHSHSTAPHIQTTHHTTTPTPWHGPCP